jgi:two-component system OmpR family response regulator
MYEFCVVSAEILPGTNQPFEPDGQLEHFKPLEMRLEEIPRALVVDDSPDIAEMLAMMLRVYGYDTTTSYSAKDGLAAAKTDHFDVIVADIEMPLMNGYAFARAIRENPEYKEVPMVAVTGFAEFSDRERAIEAGFNAHLTKPVEAHRLLCLIAGAQS